MKIVVCAKIINGEINPFDACALEAALGIENAEITLLTMGAPSVENALLRLSRLNVSRVVLLTDKCLAGSDTLVTGRALALAIKRISPDLVLCGRQSIDGDTAQVGPCLSQMLGFGLITNVMEILSLGSTAVCKTRLSETEEAAMPAVLTLERINTLRFPSLRSKPKQIEKWSAADIGLKAEECGLKASPTKVLKTFESHIGERKCSFISFDELDGVIKAELAKEDAQTEETQTAEVKLKNITVIGDVLLEEANKLAENVRVITSRDADEIAELVQSDSVVLWPADLWGRRTAPLVAAKLQTGLCADCTRLETDGEKLYMYRPAFGGTLTAKIECRTLPQMATVRCRSDKKQSDIILAIGKGAVCDKEKYLALAEKYEAQIGASRGAVDMNEADYSAQIGLTGKNVAPKIYIACGISGAIQHTCGIERAKTVIAINPDKDARIFSFADYGIIGKL